MNGDSWASCPVLPWDCRNAKWSGLRISFPSSSFLLPLFLLPPGDTASWREEGRRRRRGEGCMCVCVKERGGGADSHRAQQVSHHPTVQEFRLQHHNRLGTKSKVQVHFTLLQCIGARIVCVFSVCAFIERLYFDSFSLLKMRSTMSRRRALPDDHLAHHFLLLLPS